MKDSHRISVRFNLSDPNQRKVYEALHEIDRQEHGSMSAFAIKAIGEYSIAFQATVGSISRLMT